MSGETAATPPPVLWAQTKGVVYLTFSIECADPTLRIEKESVYFKGINAQDKKPYELTIELYAPVVPDSSTTLNKGRCIEITLHKENKETSYWPSLTKDKRKPHWLKVDFNKWKDEDESGDEGAGGADQMDLEQMLASMGGGAGGLGAGGGDSGKPSFDDLGTDSDDEDLPDLE